MKNYDTIIVGAGMAGLAAASEIYKSNRHIIVLEARDRIGGRLSSERLHDGLLFERGGELIHGTKNPMYELVKELGIEIRELKKESPDMSIMDSFQMLIILVLLRIGIYPKPHLDENLAEYLNRLRFLPQSLRNFFDQASKDFETLDKVSALHMLDAIRQQLLQGEIYGEHDFIIEDGYVTLLNYLAKDLPIALKHEAHKIIWKDEQVIVETNQGLFRAKKVILTLPIAILKKMQFEPELPDNKQVALSAHVTGDIIKLLIPVQKKAFKTEHEEGKIVGARLVPMWWRRNAPLDKLDDRQILVGWITGPYARDYLRRLPDDALNASLDELSEVVDIDQINRDEIIAQNWMQDKFSAGTYCYIKPDFSLDVINDLTKPLSNRLFFAGTATSRAAARGTAHGAYESGLRVAKEVLAK